ncbi:uncharacterized protein LOC103469282 [Poecilia reticulata]|uniref:uncharacterized protein LOC103469282 n=1 Tax=Poecilia reticulata TaxID=8081 RepID=UPI0007EB1BBE|nr:PREDICTED: uncharacterized protein LOC103469282 [Poecilia reticulata]
MSDAWTRIFTFLCLCCAAEMKGEVWKKVGQSITIQCRTESDQDFLNLKKKSVNEETDIVGVDKATERRVVLQGMTERVQTYGAFPNVDIVIKNLNENDTGSYWCVYSKTSETFNQQIAKGDGSVLLYVTETEEVIWRESGQSVTIRCRINTDQDFLVLKMGLNQETEVAVINGASKKRNFHKTIAGRVQTNGTFPSVDIVIENLNVSDSGPYWCVYSKLDDNYHQLVKKGYGSVLLMVTGNSRESTTIMEVPKCDASSLTLVVVYVRITVIVLIGLMLGFSTLIMYKSHNKQPLE